MDSSDSDSDLEQCSRDVPVGKHGQHDIARILKDSVVSPGKPLPGPSKDQSFDKSGIDSSPVSSSLSTKRKRKRKAYIELEQSVRKLKVTRANVNSSESLAATSNTQRFDNLGNDSRTVSSNSSGNGLSDDELEESDANDGQANRNLHLDIKEKYDALGLKNNLHGGIYQLKHLMLILNRARMKGYRFRLATEMDLAEKFDDLVFEYEDETGRTVHRFVQLKHKQDGNKRITARKLLSDKGDFSVKKYYISWHNIKSNEKFAGSAKDFILCTNIGLDLQGLRKNGITPIKWTESDEVLEITNTEKQPPRYKLEVDGSSELWTELKSASDANNIHHREMSCFLKEFILAVNQPNEVELSKLIAHEFGACSQFNLLNADLPMNSFQDKILDWFKNKEGVFLVREDVTKFFAEMERELSALVAMGLSLSYSAKLKEHEIRFENEIKGLRDFLDNSEVSVNLILQLTSFEQTLLSALRIHQAIEQSERYKKKDSFIFIELKNLLLPGNMDVLFRAFQSPRSHHLLIIDFGLDSTTRNTDQLWHNVHKNMKKLDEGKITGKRIIFIIPKKDLGVMALEIAHQTIHEKAGDVNIDKLTRLTQEKLLDKEVIKLQGHQQKTSFTRLLGTNNFVNVVGDELENYTRIVNQETSVKLIRDEEIRIGGEVEGLGEVRDYYIPRTIRRVVIKADILRDPQIPDIFALDGVDSESLAKLLTNKSKRKKITSQEQQIDTAKYIILESSWKSDHFDSVRKQNMNINIHWLQAGSGKFVWIRSFGSIANLRKFKDESRDCDDDERQSEILLSEDQLAEHNEQIGKIVILSDTAGMGKSTLLTCLAQKIKKNEPSLLVIRIDLTAHTRVLNIEKYSRSFGSNNVEGALDFLVDKLIRKHECWDVSLWKYLIRSQQGAALLFDGFDEISPDYGRIVIDLLLALAKLNVKKLFVTTRPHTSGELEKTLEIFSHTLEPFSWHNQIDFLTEFWRKTLPAEDSIFRPDETEKHQLRERAREVLNLLAKSIDLSMVAFTGVPLQTRMVAEIIPFDGSELPETLDIIELYTKFVDKKYSIFSSEKKRADDTNLAVKATSRAGRLRYLEIHRKLALDLLFDKDTVSRLLLTQPKADCFAGHWKKEIEDVHRTGIVTLDSDGLPYFIHRTFAEYFAATFLVKTLNDHNRNQQVRKFFVSQFFVKPEYQITRAFVNCLLKGEDYTPGDQIWHFNLPDYVSKVGSTLYHVAARERHIEIVKFFISTLKELSGDQFSNINCRSESGDTAPHISSEASDLGLVKYLLGRGANIEAKDSYGLTPLGTAAYSGNVDVVKHLLEAGANIEAEGSYGLTPLGTAAYSGNVDVVKHLLKAGANIEAADEDGWTPLGIAASSGNVDVVKHLLEAGANIEAADEDGWTPLRIAASSGNVNVVKHLLEREANIEAEDGRGWTPLGIAASWGHVDVVKYLLEEGANIEAANEDGWTPLGIAAFSGNVDVVKHLLEAGANIEAAENNGTTPLGLAASQGNEDVVRYLLEQDADIEAEDNDGRTPLGIAAYSGNEEVVRYLLEQDADIEAEDNDGRTPLGIAAYSGNEDVVRLLENGPNIEVADEDGRSFESSDDEDAVEYAYLSEDSPGRRSPSSSPRRTS